MVSKQEQYSKQLKAGDLDGSAIASLLAELDTHLSCEAVPDDFLHGGERGPTITKWLSRLPLRVATEPRGWAGLVVPFPGSPAQLATGNVGTPYLRKILYPTLDLFHRLNDDERYKGRMTCLYLLGAQFSDVFLRKFRLLSHVIPHVIVLTDELVQALSAPLSDCSKPRNEACVQARLVEQMKDGGFRVQLQGGDMELDYLMHEVPTGEGTQKPERLDILAVDKGDKSLVAFEIKGKHAGRVERENLFLQGLEHRDWLERNKMAVKLLLDGPGGTRINTRKRVKMLLGWFGGEVPDHFWELREQAMRYDRYLRIDFVRLEWSAEEGSQVVVTERPVS